MPVPLKNTSGATLYLGTAGGRRVEAGEVITVEGELSKDSPDDAYLIGAGDAARAYPKSTWTHAGGKGRKDADIPAPTEEI